MSTPTTFRPRLLQALERSDAPERVSDLRGLSLVAFGPQSNIGLIQMKSLVDAGANFVLAIDDVCRERQLHGVPVVSSAVFVAGAARLKGAVIIDFSAQPYPLALCRQLGRASGLPVRDVMELLAAFDGAAVYETVPDNRMKTLARADDWLRLADRFADDFSRETLYAVLLMRIEYTRDPLRRLNLGGRDEYFGQPSGSDSFVLGSREHFVDCGAHTGTVIHRMLGACGGRYASIDAFEPDASNHAALSWLTAVPLDNFRAHRCAVSDRTETLRFAALGNMGSHVDANGDVQVQAVRLDDTLEHATFIKMDTEGYEPRALQGASRLLDRDRPRLAIASYHYAHDLLSVAETIDRVAPGYVMRLRQHFAYHFDSIIYASPRADWLPEPHVA